jgi:arsenical pump membrane protein
VGDALLAVVLAGSLFALYARPGGIREWQAAGAGGIAAWAVSPLSWGDGLATLRDEWGIFAFFFGLMLIAAGAEASGLYATATRVLAAGDPRNRAILAVVVSGTVITAILSNDATPLVLTPAVFAAARVRGFDARPAAFAATFTADGASLLLPISNPVNLLFYERLDLTFGWYAGTVLPAAVAGALALGFVCWLRLPRLAASVETYVPPAARVSHSSNAVQRGLALLTIGILAGAYVAGAIAGLPLGIITVAGGFALVLPGLLTGRASLPTTARSLSPGLFVFVAGLLLLVESATAAGFFDHIGDVLDALAGQPTVVTVGGAAVIAALLSNVMNNWPAALLLSAGIAVTPGQPLELIAGVLIGCTIGANFTMLGSLSTVLWLALARPRGLHVTPTSYARAAFLPTLAGLVAAVLVAATLLAWPLM